jgi:hypothetical protein
MEITKREIIISVAITAVMFIIGFFISGKITDMQNDKNAEYQKAIHIEDSELFQYGMDTKVGNAFVYGDLQAVDTVTFDEIGGEYLYVEKVKEKYTRHTRTYTVKVGKTTQVRTETYWTWDEVNREDKQSLEIMFCGVTLPSVKVEIPDTEYIDTIKESSKIRYKYYGTPIKHTGTVYTKLSDGTISDNSRFFRDYTIEQALDSCTFGDGNIVFWVFWIALTVGAVVGFCYLDNRWLED